MQPLILPTNSVWHYCSRGLRLDHNWQEKESSARAADIVQSNGTSSNGTGDAHKSAATSTVESTAQLLRGLGVAANVIDNFMSEEIEELTDLALLSCDDLGALGIRAEWQQQQVISAAQNKLKYYKTHGEDSLCQAEGCPICLTQLSQVPKPPSLECTECRHYCLCTLGGLIWGLDSWLCRSCLGGFLSAATYFTSIASSKRLNLANAVVHCAVERQAEGKKG